MAESPPIVWGLARVQPARFFVVGESPSPRWQGDPQTLLASRPFELVAALLFPARSAKDAWADYLDCSDRANVLQRVQSSMPWRRAQTEEAAVAGAEILRRACGRRIYAVGRRAAAALGIEVREFGALDGIVVTLPHPSGRNRWWHDPSNVESLAKSLAEC